jgi:hypothetical protein
LFSIAARDFDFNACSEKAKVDEEIERQRQELVKQREDAEAAAISEIDGIHKARKREALMMCVNVICRRRRTSFSKIFRRRD